MPSNAENEFVPVRSGFDPVGGNQSGFMNHLVFDESYDESFEMSHR